MQMAVGKCLLPCSKCLRTMRAEPFLLLPFAGPAQQPGSGRIAVRVGALRWPELCCLRDFILLRVLIPPAGWR